MTRGELLQALRLCPGVASTYSALGLVQALVGDYEAAVVSLHKALSLHRDHTTATTLLNAVMEQLTAQTPTFQGAFRGGSVAVCSCFLWSLYCIFSNFC